MRRRGHAAIDHAEVADDAPRCAECRTVSPPCDCELGAEEWMRESLRVLARNLRDAAGCALAWRLHRDFELSWRAGDCEAWCPNLDGEPAPGWER